MNAEKKRAQRLKLLEDHIGQSLAESVARVERSENADATQRFPVPSNGEATVRLSSKAWRMPPYKRTTRRT